MSASTTQSGKAIATVQKRLNRECSSRVRARFGTAAILHSFFSAGRNRTISGDDTGFFPGQGKFSRRESAKPVIDLPESRLRTRPAFSLIELLVVIAIIMVLAALTLPAMRGISGGAGVTGASEELSAVVNLARQRASTFNRQVAIRFFREGGTDTPFDRFQLWEQKDSADPTSWTSIERMRHLPAGVVVTNSGTYSPILEVAEYQGTTNSANYSDILLLPSGSIVAQSNVVVTLVQKNGPQTGGTVAGLPPNFATVVVEPMNVRPTIYRP